MRFHFLLFLILLFLPLISFAQDDCGYNINHLTIVNGGGIVENENYKIKGSFGQSMLGEISNESMIVNSGFWQAAQRLAGFNIADFNKDGKIDVIDLQLISAHYEFEVTCELRKYDVNNDGDIDISDVREVRNALLE
jgi:hypothetical protein